MNQDEVKEVIKRADEINEFNKLNGLYVAQTKELIAVRDALEKLHVRAREITEERSRAYEDIRKLQNKINEQNTEINKLTNDNDMFRGIIDTMKIVIDNNIG
jgi:ethanolamine ammonia-lyase large subunit